MESTKSADIVCDMCFEELEVMGGGITNNEIVPVLQNCLIASRIIYIPWPPESTTHASLRTLSIEGVSASVSFDDIQIWVIK